MKALILAAGLGTRLKPLTDQIPKAMVEVGGKPLLYYNIKNLKKHGIKKIWINLHYLPHVIQNYFGDGKKIGVKIHYSYEKELLGTSGALRNHSSGIEKEFKNTSFLVFYGDHLTNINFKKMIEQHKTKRALMTVALYQHDKPWTKGVVELDTRGKVLHFIEKPHKDKITSNLVNSGFYICEKEIFKFIPEGFSDFGFDIFPRLLRAKKKIMSYIDDFYIKDIGTFESLKQAREDLRFLNL